MRSLSFVEQVSLSMELLRYHTLPVRTIPLRTNPPRRTIPASTLVLCPGPATNWAENAESQSPFGLHFRLVIGSSSSALSPLTRLDREYVRATVTYSYD